MENHPGNGIVQLWTAEDVARRLQISEGTVKQWVKAGRLPVVKVGKLNRFRPSDIEAWLDAQPTHEPEDMGEPDPTPQADDPWETVRAQEIAKRRTG